MPTSFRLRVTASLIFASACSDAGTNSPPPSPASVTIVLARATVELRTQLQATAVVRDAAGEVMVGHQVEWSSANPAVASIDAGGTITPVTIGSVYIRASAGGKTGTAPIFVIAPALATIEIGLHLDTLFRNGSARARAAIFDNQGTLVLGRQVEWRSSNPAVAAVFVNGQVALQGPGTTTISARLDDLRGEYVLTVPPVVQLTIAGDPRAKLYASNWYSVDARTSTGARIALPARWSVPDPTAGAVDAYGEFVPDRTGAVTLRAEVGGVVATQGIDVYDWTMMQVNGGIRAELTAQRELYRVGGVPELPTLTLSCTAGQLSVGVNTSWNGSAVVPVSYVVGESWGTDATWNGAANMLAHPGPTNAAVREFIAELEASPWFYFYYWSADEGARDLEFRLAGIGARAQQVMAACP